MKLKEIRTLPEDEVESEIDKARAKIFKMRFQAKGENVENPGSLRTLRRHIARLKTVARERQIQQVARTGSPAVSPSPAGSGEGGASPPSLTEPMAGGGGA